MFFYSACALVGLFCAVALGLGPALFVLLGVMLAVVAFRERRRRWWGLAGTGAGLGLVLGVATGWGWTHVLIAMVVGFVVLLAARTASRAADRRASSGRW